MAFFLQGICLGVGGAEDLDGVGLHFACLTFAHRLYEAAGDVDAGPGGDAAEVVVGEAVHVEDHLEVFDCGAVVEGNELHVFVAAACAHPSHHAHFGADEFGREYVDDFRSFHLVIYGKITVVVYSKAPILRKLTSSWVR